MTNYQTEVQKLDDLAIELNSSKERLKREPPSELGGHPPLWSGELLELEEFADELGEWLDEPKLKEVKNIIRDFQGLCSDEREFQFDSNKGYYKSILDILTQGKDVLEKIDNGDIKKEGTRIILDHVFQQKKGEELKAEINKIEEFWDEFKEKIINFDTKNDEFTEQVKDDIIKNLIKLLKTDFTKDAVSNGYLKIEKAKKSRELLKEIDSNAFLSEYEKNKDIDRIWNVSNEIRRKLDSTNVDVVGISEDTQRKIFSELLNYVKNRNDALKESDFTKIKKKLDDVFGNLGKWGEKVNGFINDNIIRLDSWLLAIQVFKSKSEKIQDITDEITPLRQKFNSLRFDNAKDVKTKVLYGAFEEYYKLKKDIEDIFKDLLSNDARRILDNFSNLEELRNEMGDTFWIAAKELCGTFPRLKIKMEWGEV